MFISGYANAENVFYCLNTTRKKTTFLYVSRRMFWRLNENAQRDQSITQKLQFNWN